MDTVHRNTGVICLCSVMSGIFFPIYWFSVYTYNIYPCGGERKLGIPTLLDRIAQKKVKTHLERIVEP